MGGLKYKENMILLYDGMLNWISQFKICYSWYQSNDYLFRDLIC
jgi:hypothetical protein